MIPIQARSPMCGLSSVWSQAAALYRPLRIDRTFSVLKKRQLSVLRFFFQDKSTG
jgi:hypothetical protein